MMSAFLTGEVPVFVLEANASIPSNEVPAIAALAVFNISRLFIV
jgi:hypothetical protein